MNLLKDLHLKANQKVRNVRQPEKISKLSIQRMWTHLNFIDAILFILQNKKQIYIYEEKHIFFFPKTKSYRHFYFNVSVDRNNLIFFDFTSSIFFFFFNLQFFS